MCEKQISTENGVLTCDKKTGHQGLHHAKHKGGLVTFTDRRHDATNLSPIKDEKGIALAVHEVRPLEVEWPQEGMNDPVKLTRG